VGFRALPPIVGFKSARFGHIVRQSAKSEQVPDVLTAEEIGKLLSELREPWRAAVCVAVTTGLRVSELLALKWAAVALANATSV
jgi:integrase